VSHITKKNTNKKLAASTALHLLLKSDLISTLAHIPNIQLPVLIQASVNVALPVAPGQNARKNVGNPDDCRLAATEENVTG
jgi:hypothetical protein